MPHDAGYYGAYPDPNSDTTFKPTGEPEKRDKRGTIDMSGVPGTPPTAGYPAEPDMPTSSAPHGGLSMEEVVRRATNAAVQPINKPIANPDIVGGSDAAMPVEPGV